MSVEYPQQTIRIRSNKEITIRIPSVSVRITDIRKIYGATENAGVENAGALKMPRVKNAGVEIVAP